MLSLIKRYNIIFLTTILFQLNQSRHKFYSSFSNYASLYAQQQFTPFPHKLCKWNYLVDLKIRFEVALDYSVNVKAIAFFFFFHRNYISLCAHNNNHLPPIPSLFSLKSKLCSWNYHEDERALKLKFSHVNNASIAYEKKKN